MRKAKGIYSGLAIARESLACILADSKAAKDGKVGKEKRKALGMP